MWVQYNMFPFSMSSCLGSLFNFKVKSINCFCGGGHHHPDDLEEIVETAEKNNVIVLPARQGTTITNLYPLSNHTSTWNILCVGSDRTYIHTKIHDLNFQGSENLVDTKYSELMSESMRNLLDSVWEKTLAGKVLMFYLVFRGKTFLTNAFPLFNENFEAIGAITFIRNVEHLTTSSEYPRLSIDGVAKKASIPVNHLDTLLENNNFKN